MNLYDIFEAADIKNIFNSALEYVDTISKVNPIVKAEITTLRNVRQQDDIITSTVSEFGNSEFNEEEVKETYSNYEPKKLRIGKAHAYTVVESRSLVSIEPPDITYNLLMPSITIRRDRLSNVQLEAIVYACQKHETFLSDDKRAGFLIGDGAGVGKGRTVAGIIYENILAGRNRSIWISISSDLIEDAQRDFRDINADVKVISINKMSYKKDTYTQNDKDKNEVLFVTYSSLIGKTKINTKNAFNTRFEMIVKWFGEEYDGVIIFDECHKAKNLSSEIKKESEIKSKAALHVKLLQDKLPNARIVYSSATGASEPSHMGYMVRLGLWGPGQICSNFQDFEKKLKRHGVSSMELVAMDMKRRGAYIARQLSFQDIKFDIIEVKIEEEKVNGHIFKTVYNKCVDIWTNLYNEFQSAYARNYASIKDILFFERIFWSSHQNFFKYLCISGKVSSCVKLALSEVKNGKCVVIGLQSTGESKTKDILEENDGELFDFVSSAKEVLKSMIQKHYPSLKRIAELNDKKKGKYGDDDYIDLDDDESDKENENSTDRDIKEYLLKDIKEIENVFPLNTLDQLIMELGGSDFVAEMTGRKGRVVKRADGSISYEQRKERNIALDQVNIMEKELFNKGAKLIAIISDAASTGISLHSDSRFKNKRQRVHITLELPWSADKAIQQFGRTHRSNQIIPPHYKFIISDLAGEKRFAATVAKRLESLGALTHGDRRAGDSKDLSQFNLEHEIGLKSVNAIIQTIFCNTKPILPFPEHYLAKYKISGKDFQNKAENSLTKVGISDKNTCTVARFLNRLLGIDIDMQNALFQYFVDIIDHKIKDAKTKDGYDHGIRDINSDSITSTLDHEFSSDAIEAGAKISIFKMEHISNGISWLAALQRYNEDPLRNYFCILNSTEFRLCSLFIIGQVNEVILVTPMFPEKRLKESELLYRWKKVDFKVAEPIWIKLHEGSQKQCLHSLLNDSECLKRNCSYGKRTKTNFMISGAIFAARSLIDDSSHKIRIDVARVKLEDEKKIGAFFSQNHYERVIEVLSKKYENKVAHLEKM